ncbi:MAG: gluconate 2-dehydrogenase subunit 3 family protein [Balneolaceae bacterium]|nr:gluconate 2-dehydrogenase subunit 3 family protein [Balneolaceae bacterium]
MNNRAIEHFSSSFTNCTQQQRKQIFLSFDGSEDQSEQRFFQLVKNETIRGFRTSKVVMQEYHGYRVVPGFYNGNVDVEV